ncbi:MAG: aminopeptidase P family protein [Lachnospiraceae bacterium]|jgi:Xaa-Pro aminopeptidase|nr:aminopeptidase P family protein [Lachnospiraceae bacterium]
MDIFEKRRNNLKELLNEKKFDAVLIESPENLFYYTGFTGGEAAFLMSVEDRFAFKITDTSKDASMCIITDSRYYEQVEKECPGIALLRLEKHTYMEVFKELLMSDLKLAVEDSMNLTRYLKFVEEIKNVKLDVCGELINRPRMVKDETELELIRRAEAIGDEAFTHVLDIIKPGVMENDIALEIEFFMRKQGASKLSFDTIVASGTNSSMPHAQVTDKVIENGDFVTMDFGCVYKGYCSDMTRTVVAGKPSDEMKKVYDIVFEANKRAMAGIKEGVKCNDIDSLARDYIKECGYGEYFGHGLGHGVGLYIHEEPRFSPKCDVVTKENMVITDEPGIYLPGKFGVRIEDLVVVKKDGCEVLSHSPKELIII